jgi:hypothetical protein
MLKLFNPLHELMINSFHLSEGFRILSGGSYLQLKVSIVGLELRILIHDVLGIIPQLDHVLLDFLQELGLALAALGFLSPLSVDLRVIAMLVPSQGKVLHTIGFIHILPRIHHHLMLLVRIVYSLRLYHELRVEHGKLDGLLCLIFRGLFILILECENIRF